MARGRGNPRRSRGKPADAFIRRLRRREGHLELRKRFLIVCEDSKSAVNYFIALREHLKVVARAITPVGNDRGRTQPMQVVQYAADIRDRHAGRHSAYDEAWAVVDGDFGPAKIAEAIGLADGQAIELAVTTPCFEYWLLLHYTECRDRRLSSEQAERELRKHVHHYGKGMSHPHFRSIVPHHRAATDRARQGREPRRETCPNPARQKPCSELYRLIDSIRSSMPRQGGA